MKQKIADLLKQSMGLDEATLGRSALDHAVRSRMDLCGLRDLECYWRRLQSSKNELQELIEAVVVPETWFFRDGEAFAALAKLVKEEWLPAHRTDVLRVLSVPCASGEEPYSIAMALLDAGLSPHSFIIDALDISTRLLALAERAVYGRNSFRVQELGFRDRHFRATKHGHALEKKVRDQVRFEQGNLLAADFMAGAGGYDAIYCRNVLIYFDPPTQQRVIRTLNRMLAAEGFLFVGASEAFLLRESGFLPANLPRAVAHRKSDLIAPQTRERICRTRPPARCAGPAPRPLALAVPPISPKVSTSLEPEPAGGLDRAKNLADVGRLREAAEACEAHLQENHASIQAWFLLGLVRDAMGDERANDCYRKVIYLKPDHPEALIHLALFAKKSGDAAGARRFQLRAERIGKSLQT